MKVFFDANVYVAEALLGRGAKRLLDATRKARWRTFISQYLVDEVIHVLVDELGFSRRLAHLTGRRMVNRGAMVKPLRTAEVPKDPKDSPILQAALSCGADYLVSNDRHLRALDPFESLRIVSMDEFHEILRQSGLL